jgi:hypothetical protein
MKLLFYKIFLIIYRNDNIVVKLNVPVDKKVPDESKISIINPKKAQAKPVRHIIWIGLINIKV